MADISALMDDFDQELDDAARGAVTAAPTTPAPAAAAAEVPSGDGDGVGGGGSSTSIALPEGEPPPQPEPAAAPPLLPPAGAQLDAPAITEPAPAGDDPLSLVPAPDVSSPIGGGGGGASPVSAARKMSLGLSPEFDVVDPLADAPIVSPVVLPSSSPRTGGEDDEAALAAVDAAAAAAEEEDEAAVDPDAVVSPFGLEDSDAPGGVMHGLKTALLARDGPEHEGLLREAAAAMQSEEHRTALRQLLEKGIETGRLVLDRRTFHNLVEVFEAALLAVLEQNDMQNASVYLRMVDQYYMYTAGGGAPSGGRGGRAGRGASKKQARHMISNEKAVRESPIWKSLPFWEGTVFEVLARQHEMMDASMPASASVRDMDEAQLQEKEAREATAGFEQVQQIMTQMLAFGAVPLEKVVDFREKMERLEVVKVTAHGGDEKFSHLKHLDYILQDAMHASVIGEWPRGWSQAPAAANPNWAESPYNTGTPAAPLRDAYGFLVQEHDAGTYAKQCLAEAALAEKDPGGAQAAEQRSKWEEWHEAFAADLSLRVGGGLVRQGLPAELRAKTWRALTAGAREAISRHRGGLSYAELNEHVSDEMSPGRSPDLKKWEKIIDQDLHRTFPDHEMIDSEQGKDALRRLLTCYADRNREVGYCQSMNFIAAALYLVMAGAEHEPEMVKAAEEEAFWMQALIEERVLKEYHSRHMLGCRTDCRFLYELCHQYFEELFLHLEQHQTIPEVAFIHWFLCIFINALPFGTAMSVWDWLFAECRDKQGSATGAAGGGSNRTEVTFGEGTIGIQFKKQPKPEAPDPTPLAIGKLRAGLAKQDGRLVPGMVLVMVQGVSVDGLSYNETMQRMKLAQRPLRLMFEHLRPPETELLVRVALASLEMLQRPLLAAQSSQDVNQVLKRGMSQLFDVRKLLEKAANPKWEITSAHRARVRQTLIEEQEHVDVNRKTSKAKAENRRIVTNASNLLAAKYLKVGWRDPFDVAHEGEREPGQPEDERVLRASAQSTLGQRCVVRLLNGDLYSGTLFLTTARITFLAAAPSAAPKKPPLFLDCALCNIQASSVQPAVRLANGLELKAPTLKVVCKDARRLYFIVHEDLMNLLQLLNDEAAAGQEEEEESPLPPLGSPQVDGAESGGESSSRSRGTPRGARPDVEKSKRALQTNLRQSLRQPRGKGMFGSVFSGGGEDPADLSTPAEEVSLRGFCQGLEITRKKQTVSGGFPLNASPSDCKWVGQGRYDYEYSRHDYDAMAEFTRQGVFEALSEDPSNKGEPLWRATPLNEDFQLAETYPRVLIEPQRVTEEELKEVAKFRSKQRLPALSWFDGRTYDAPDEPKDEEGRPQPQYAAIVRCAQPLVGIQGKKSPADEKLFKLIAEARRIQKERKPLVLVDARPFVNAQANRLRKGGYEDVSHYEGASTDGGPVLAAPELLFLNIDNIHEMRDSINKMHALFTEDEDRPVNKEVTRAEVHSTSWLTHVGRVLGGVRRIVEETLSGRSSIVHCSDGWDRTAQLCAGAELCLDPYYRTFEGFRVVVQREWHSFGHKFRDRTWGEKETERSPVFVQFLDVVHQLMLAYPRSFEFNEWLLLSIIDAMHTNGHSPFRFNNEKQSYEARQEGQAVEYWAMFDGDARAQFVNERYTPLFTGRKGHTPRVLLPPRIAVVWLGYFNRWIREPVAGLPESHPDVQRRSGGEQKQGAHTLESIADPGLRERVRRPLMRQAKQKLDGWLWKSGLIDKHHYFVFFPTTGTESQPSEAALVYFDQEPTAFVPKGVLALPDGRYQVQRVHQTDGREDRFPFTLTINTGPTDSTTHMFSAESEVQQTMWIECFQQATRQLGTGGGIRTSFGRAGGGAPVKKLSRSKSDRAAAAAAARRSGGGLISDEPLVELKLHRGQFGFGVNVSEVAVVLDVRDSAKHCGMRKGHIISKINGETVLRKTDVMQALKAAGDEACFSVHVPLMLEIGRKRQESLTVSLKPGQRMHWAFTLQSGTLNYEAAFHSKSGEKRPTLGDEADVERGGVWSHSYASSKTVGELKFLLHNNSMWSVKEVLLSAHIETSDGKIFLLKLTKAPKGWTMWNKELLQ